MSDLAASNPDSLSHNHSPVASTIRSHILSISNAIKALEDTFLDEIAKLKTTINVRDTEIDNLRITIVKEADLIKERDRVIVELQAEIGKVVPQLERTQTRAAYLETRVASLIEEIEFLKATATATGKE